MNWQDKIELPNDKQYNIFIKNLEYMSNLNKFVNSIIENNGASFNINTGEFNPNDGFFVSLKGFEKVVDKEGLTSHVASFVQENAFQLSKLDMFLGGWVREDDSVALDISIKVPTLCEALKLGNDNEQDAIFDAANEEVINLK